MSTGFRVFVVTANMLTFILAGAFAERANVFGAVFTAGLAGAITTWAITAPRKGDGS